jgi:hypothetical protein
MRNKDRDLILATLLVGVAFSALTSLLWFPLRWISLLIMLPATIVLELILLNWIDTKYTIAEKQKLIQLGIMTSGETLTVSVEGKDEIDQLRSFVRLNLTDLNELLLSLEEGYREALGRLDIGEIEDAKGQFKSVSEATLKRLKELSDEVEELFEEFPIPADKEKKFLFNSYKDHWNAEKKDKEKIIEDIIQKFKVRSVFTVHLEDILQTEVENKRPITDADIKRMRYPYNQANQLIKFIEKPVSFKLETLSPEEKQKYGTLGRKIIENCAKNQLTPNLPYLVVKLGITLQESKKILTYLHLVGMVEEVYYHYKK